MSSSPAPQAQSKKAPDIPMPPPISVSEHWRAGPFIRRAKGLGGLAGFALTGLAGMRHGAALQDLLWHGLIGGLIGWLVAWGVGLAVWRQLIPAETRHLVDGIIEARREAAERQEERRVERAAATAATAAATAAAEAAAEAAAASDVAPTWSID